MIDPADTQTQSLPLDNAPVKRGRGRPSTGKAMTPAEKQRAYRERLKQRESKLEGTAYAYEKVCEEKREVSMKLIKTEARVLVLEQQLANALAEIERPNKSNVAGLELTNAEATAIISLLQDKAREMAWRNGEQIDPKQQESINWLMELSGKIAREKNK